MCDEEEGPRCGAVSEPPPNGSLLLQSWHSLKTRSMSVGRYILEACGRVAHPHNHSYPTRLVEIKSRFVELAVTALQFLDMPVNSAHPISARRPA